MQSLSDIDFRARVFVCGMREAKVSSDNAMSGKKIINSGSFSAHFQDHPWVQKSIKEGFCGELRQHCIAQVKSRMGTGKDFTDIGSLMPEKSLIEYWSQQAKRFAMGTDWRNKIKSEYGSVDAFIGRGRKLDRNWQGAKSKP